jgi:hypothetical protein
VTLTSDTPSTATASGTTVQGLSAGPGTISASVGGRPLAGEELYLVSSPSSSGGGSGGGSSGGGTPTVDGCCVAHAPTYFSRPGLEETLRVWVFLSTPPANGGLLPGLAVEQRSPDSVQLDRGGIVAVGTDGLLMATGGGRAKYKLFVAGLLCGQEMVSVAPDLSGTWTVTCNQGGSPGPGTLALGAAAPVIDTIGTAQCSVGGRSGSELVEASGTGCLTPPGKPACSGYAAISSVQLGQSPGFGPCGAGFSCNFALQDCTGASLNPAGADDGLQMVAPGTMQGTSGCTYQRGGVAGSCGWGCQSWGSGSCSCDTGNASVDPPACPQGTPSSGCCYVATPDAGSSPTYCACLAPGDISPGRTCAQEMGYGFTQVGACPPP